MTAHRDDVLTDARLEQEIEQALAIDPSPEFLVRVRAQIASAPQASRWSMRWPLVTASAAAVVLIVAAVVLSGLMRSRQPVTPESPAIVRAIDPPVGPPTITPVAQAVEPRRPLAPPMTARRVMPRSTEPEVLIPKDEADALRRLLRGLRIGVVDPSTLAQNSRASAVVAPTTEIVLKPLAPLTPVTLEPLAPIPHQEGVRQ
jgi:hypothetical protein